MSGILLAQQQIILPRLISGLGWSSSGSGGILGASIFLNPNGVLQGFSNSGGTVSLQGWLPIQSMHAFNNTLFQVKIDNLGPSGSLTDNGVFRNIDTSTLQWDCLNAQAAPSVHVVTFRITIRLKNSSVDLAVQTYTLTYNFT